jgi:hypothetical protein
MDHEFLTPDETRELLAQGARRNAALRAKYPASARLFPPLSDAEFAM